MFEFQFEEVVYSMRFSHIRFISECKNTIGGTAPKPYCQSVWFTPSDALSPSIEAGMFSPASGWKWFYCDATSLPAVLWSEMALLPDVCTACAHKCIADVQPTGILSKSTHRYAISGFCLVFVFCILGRFYIHAKPFSILAQYYIS